MQISFETLKDKIGGCWQGKNIGGILGIPDEGQRKVNNLEFYSQDFEKDGVPMNDDLDLQIVWLNAVEKFGRGVNASILGDYWLSYIVPNWSEYGMGKNNLRAGMQPPLSGYVENNYKDSCGCYIRSEIWACLCPGHPDLAARYAYEDAIVDHATEGVYGEIFCAALEAAAFVESDKWKLIDIGLSYIPEGCKVREAVLCVIDSYKSGKSWIEARDILFKKVPGHFGIQNTKLADMTDEYDYSQPGMDAPNNIGIMILGWVYGEDDFGKSLCTAVNCGEDTDCTAATLGAVLGIICGEKNLPEKWISPICGEITIGCVNKMDKLWLPKTVCELSDRVLRNIPQFLGIEFCDIFAEEKGFTVESAENFEYEGDTVYIPGMSAPIADRRLPVRELAKLSPYGVRNDFPMFYTVLDYMDEPYIKVGEPRKMRLIISDSGLTAHPDWADVTLYTSDGVQILQGNYFSVPINHTYKYKAVIEFEVFAEYFSSNKIDIMIDVSLAGRHSYGAIKATLYTKS